MTELAGRDTPVAITGIGLVTPAGIGVAANWERLLSGRPTAQRDPALAGLPVDISCRVPGFDANALLGRSTAWRLDRVSQLALVAAQEALSDAGLDPDRWDGARVGVVMGNALGGTASYEDAHTAYHQEGPDQVSPLVMVNWPVNMISGYLAMHCRALGPNLVVATACASGVTAIGTARQMLQSGMCDIVLAGASEAPLSPTPMAAYHRMGALSRRTEDPAGASRPFDADRGGFVAAEAAAVLVLERERDTKARGGTVRAQVAGFGASADGHHASAPDPAGAGVERALRSALADADVAPEAVDHVNAHGTSTKLNDLMESQLINRVLVGRPSVTSTKGVTGHALGAAGAIEVAYTALTVEHGLVPPTANLDKLDPQIDIDVVSGTPREQRVETATSHSFGFGGQNAVLVLQKAGTR
ncbi:3-oxoacyl-[acyl-carrier-protein] synthase II [Streptomyces sp. TLI_55]|uniref:beta-ketoacyl-[acyl-carrier-protein] synthase family protein n=1 Tax=Streptomyces sp. TLI_55 TaxID=1938861 RepID=UPI000BD68A8A|nr:beta-ketoacyl-[acyl-carrier-protein] synthase family protein [Streptomyces sp. TLI_55]SNX66102.1 3-oxoacyl-[acyl-carrier-protein] synthase II [Streptomyces sp. TLI_55]